MTKPYTRKSLSQTGKITLIETTWTDLYLERAGMGLLVLSSGDQREYFPEH